MLDNILDPKNFKQFRIPRNDMLETAKTIFGLYGC